MDVFRALQAILRVHRMRCYLRTNMLSSAGVCADVYLNSIYILYLYIYIITHTLKLMFYVQPLALA